MAGRERVQCKDGLVFVSSAEITWLLRHGHVSVMSIVTVYNGTKAELQELLTTIPRANDILCTVKGNAITVRNAQNAFDFLNAWERVFNFYKGKEDAPHTNAQIMQASEYIYGRPILPGIGLPLGEMPNIIHLSDLVLKEAMKAGFTPEPTEFKGEFPPPVREEPEPDTPVLEQPSGEEQSQLDRIEAKLQFIIDLGLGILEQHKLIEREK